MSSQFLLLPVTKTSVLTEKRRIVFVGQVKVMEDKLAKLHGGLTLVKPEERKAVEKMYLEKVSQWGKRKRMLEYIWDAITENSAKDLKEFKILFISLVSSNYRVCIVQIL